MTEEAFVHDITEHGARCDGRCAVVVLAVALGSRHARADDQGKPWTLDQNNWQLGKDLLPEVVLNRVKNGEYSYKVVPVDPEKFKQNYSKKFWEASEAQRRQVRRRSRTCGLQGRQDRQDAGLLLRLSVPQDRSEGPERGLQDGVELRLPPTDGQRPGRDVHAQRHRQDRRVQASSSCGCTPTPSSAARQGRSRIPRTCAAPACPTCSSRRTSTASAVSASASTTGPRRTSRGSTCPSTRRVRRVNAATRSDPVAGLDIFGDDLNCYGGKIEYYKWKLIGEGNILAPVLSPNPLPQKKVTDDTLRGRDPVLQRCLRNARRQGRAVVGR